MSSKTKLVITGPTMLTILRIVLVAPVLICLFMDSVPARIVAVSCFLVASLTDFIDGSWARKSKQVTELGTFLDPIADKMLVNLTLLALVVLGQVPVYIFGLILIRDLAVDGVRMLAAKNQITVGASDFGKWKTTIQMVTISLLIINLMLGNEILTIVNTVLLYMVLFLTLYSGLDYLIKGHKLMI